MKNSIVNRVELKNDGMSSIYNSNTINSQKDPWNWIWLLVLVLCIIFVVRCLNSLGS